MDYKIRIGSFDFVWDINKAQINKLRHKISFVEAATVFDDTEARIDNDPEHSEYEERFRIVGLSASGNMLMVCHCVRDGGVIRLISARMATKQEEQEYYGIW